MQPVNPYMAQIVENPKGRRLVPPVTDPERIIMLVASVWDIMPEQIKAGRQTHSLADPRAACMELIFRTNPYRAKPLSLADIGRIFGINHPAVKYGRQQAIKRLIIPEFRTRMFRAMDMVNL